MTGRFLLDTCAAIWISENANVLSTAAIDAIDQSADRGEPLYVSPITAWEIGLLVAHGRLGHVSDPLDWFNRLLATRPEAVELSPDILIASSFLPGIAHKDPADRIIIATARSHALTIIIRDRRILDYANDGHVLALAC